MPTCRVSRDFLGWAAIKKLEGSGPISTGTQVNIPAALVSPRNPENISIGSVINAANYPTVSIRGKKAPVITVQAPIKANWFSANLLNSLVMSLDSCYNTDLWSVAVAPDTGTPRVWDDCRCTSVSLSQDSVGGQINCTMQFVSIYGENEKTTPTTFIAPSAPSSGSLVDVAHVDFNSTADFVKSWSLILSRDQTYVYEIDGTYYAAGIASGMFGGSLTLTQSPRATTVPSTSFTVRIYTAGDVPSGTKVTIACTGLLLDTIRDHTPGLGFYIRSYALVSMGGVPVTIS